MTALRHHCSRHRRLAALIVAAALLMKLLVPAGFMPVFTGERMTIEICTGVGPHEMAMSGMPDHRQGKSEHGGKEMPCGFGGLAFPSLAAADPILLALAIAFLVATIAWTDIRSIARSVEHLRPPLRGPPAAA